VSPLYQDYVMQRCRENCSWREYFVRCTDIEDEILQSIQEVVRMKALVLGDWIKSATVGRDTSRI